MIRAAVDSYLALVERDPEVYRFVVAHPLLDRPVGDDPVTGLTSRIGNELAALIAAGLTGSGRDPAAAGALAHGVVGLVRAAADQWLAIAGNPLSRNELTRQLSALIGGGLTAVLDLPEDCMTTTGTDVRRDLRHRPAREPRRPLGARARAHPQGVRRRAAAAATRRWSIEAAARRVRRADAAAGRQPVTRAPASRSAPAAATTSAPR